ncbi:type II toxin-antitoxin system RelE/ParE family toxin [Gloeothece verrucosa]|uniref:Plasmid stabilization system n=1 Tax=Gloeothece verrucosa (strain PCC 7822) TaxID=497965 RepID=E0UJG3_GLOV7|nr:type II toxin-antitoxin system RelE/ParE family toxin [Gloeothece verrucosa]ADN16981.1 plasmid stabilization system [Gloeothece verrucosa PCC 7822]
MAYRVIWSPKAVEDVDAIATYIARDSPSYAAAVVRKIIDLTRQLKQCPLAGKAITELSDSAIREKFAYTYRIIYRVDDEVVTIAAVVHTKTLLEMEK